jgi:tripartite-type tricarboxylate transporter receptor subunit TctC
LPSPHIEGILGHRHREEPFMPCPLTRRAVTPAPALRGAAALTLVLAAGTLAAQPWPARPLRLIVPLAAGGTGDTLARDVAQAMEPLLGVPITVENRAGANGILGMEVVAKAPADGYTLVMGGVGPVAINPSLYPKLPFNIERDFTAIVQVADTTSVLVVPAALPVKTLKDLIALAKKRPGELFYSSSGSGSTPHLNAALFATMAGIDIQHVPYKGSTPGRTALLGGEVSLMVDGLLPSLPFIESGRFRALGITSAARSPAAPQIPTIAETLPGYQADIWYGLLGPAGTPREVVDRINAAANKALSSAELRVRLAKLGATVAGGPPEAFAKHIAREIPKWAKVVKTTGARID